MVSIRQQTQIHEERLAVTVTFIDMLPEDREKYNYSFVQTTLFSMGLRVPLGQSLAG
jgi:hypothetical protein